MSGLYLSFSFGFEFWLFVVLCYFCYVVLCDPIVLLIVFIVCLGRVSGVRSLLLRIFRVQRTSARQVHTLIIIFNTQFLLCISLTLKDSTNRIGNMWICYVVHVVGTYDLWSPREYSLCHILLNHARRPGLDRDNHGSCER